MNISAFIIGILLSIFIIVCFKKARLENSKFAYSALLFTFPFYYFIFAIYGKDYTAIPLELAGGLLFFGIAILALKFSNFNKLIILSIGYILHGVYDVIHNVFFINLGIPIWWAEFCGSIDIILGVYLLSLAFKHQTKSA